MDTLKQTTNPRGATNESETRSAPLVRLAGCSVRAGGKLLLHDVRLTLRAGQGLAVLGGNGAGKSTLLRLLRGETWPGEAGCRMFFQEQRPSASPIGFRERTAVVSAELAEAYMRLEHPLTGRECGLSGFTDSRFVTGPVPAHGGEPLERVERLFRDLDAEELLERPMAAMSEGQARLALLVRALVGRPVALFLDEAFDGLDAARRNAAMRLASSLAAAGTTIIQATHRLDELVPGLRRGVLLEQGRLVFSGGLEQALGVYRHQHSCWPTMDGAPNEPNGPDVAPSASACRHIQAVQTPSIELRHVSVNLTGRTVLRDVSLALRPGERMAVVGPNGSGKSTLLKILAGDLHPLPGGLVLRWGRPGPHDLWQVRREVGYVSAELQAGYHPEATALEVVLSGFHGSVGLYARPEAWQEGRAMALLSGAGLQALADRRLTGMSHGQRRKLMILRAMAPGPRVLLLDEPMSGLDLASRQEVRAFLTGLRALDVAMVMVSHHEADLPPGLNSVLTLDQGSVRPAAASIKKAFSRLEYCDNCEATLEEPASALGPQAEGTGGP